MCQSKAEGGIRCASHVTEALYSHADTQIKLVKEFAESVGMKIPKDDTARNAFTDATESSKLIKSKPAFLKAELAYDNAYNARLLAERTLTSVVMRGETGAVAPFLWKRNAEATALREARDEARKQGDTKTADKCVQELGALRAKTIANATLLSRIANEPGATEGGPARLLGRFREEGGGIAYLSELRNEEKAKKDNYDTTAANLRKIETDRLASKRIRAGVEFNKITSSVVFRKQPQVQAWEKRQKELQKDYAMTGEYKEKMMILAGNEEPGSDKRKEIESQIRKAELCRELAIRRNKAQAKQELQQV